MGFKVSCQLEKELLKGRINILKCIFGERLAIEVWKFLHTLSDAVMLEL